MKIGFFISLMIAIVGCAGVSSVSMPSNVDSNLPTISELRTLVDTNEVGLEWNPIDNNSIDGFFVLRGDSNKNLRAIAKISDPYASHFVDTSVSPSTHYTYEIKTYKGNKISNDGTIVNVTTAGKLQPLGFVEANYFDSGTRVIWKPSDDERVKGYEIQRASKSSSSYSTIANINGRLAAEYIDKIPNSKNYEYRVIAKGDNLSSNPTPASAK